MSTKVAINSVSMNKSHTQLSSFKKYNIEAELNEVENKKDLSILEYSFTIISDTKNIRLGIKGTVTISGKFSQIDEFLKKDENNIPKILPLVYQELFPVFFMLSKSLDVQCPPYQLCKLDASTETPEISANNESISEPTVEPTKGFASLSKPTKTVEATPEPTKTVEATPEPTKTVEATPEPTKTEETKSVDDFEKMSYEELQKTYTELNEEYAKKPTSELYDKLNKISQTLEKHRTESKIPESRA